MRGLEDALSAWEALSRKGYNKAAKLVLPEKRSIPYRVIVAGMGGSGIVGDALIDLSFAFGFDTEIITIKEPWLPGKIDEQTLVLAISYSGNTLETIAVADEAISKGADTIILTSDGRLAEMGEKRGLPLIILEDNLLPRAAFPEMFYASLKILERMGITGFLSEKTIWGSINVLSRTNDARRHASLISEQLHERTPVFITYRPYISLGERMRKDLAENAKKYSFHEVVPEAGHNSVEALYNLAPSYPLKLVYIIGKDNTYRGFASAFAEVMRERLDQVTIDLTGIGNTLEEIIWGFWVSGYTSLFLAQREGVDPEETPVLSTYRRRVRGAYM